MSSQVNKILAFLFSLSGVKIPESSQNNLGF